MDYKTDNTVILKADMMKDERIAILETKSEQLNSQLARIISHLESEDGTVERVKKYFLDHIEVLQKEVEGVKTECKLINQTLDNSKWWNRAMAVAVASLLVNLIHDLIVHK